MSNDNTDNKATDIEIETEDFNLPETLAAPVCAIGGLLICNQ